MANNLTPAQPVNPDHYKPQKEQNPFARTFQRSVGSVGQCCCDAGYHLVAIGRKSVQSRLGGFVRRRRDEQPTHLSLSLALATSIVMSGCATRDVYYLGVKTREITFQEVHIANDGDILAVGELIQEDGAYKRYAYKSARSLHKYLRVEPHKEGDIVRVAGSIGKAGDVTAWQVIPSDYRNHDATPEQLPKRFLSGSQVYSTANPVPYEAEGKIYYLQFRGIAGLGMERAPWSYACQILLLPAAAIDLAVGVLWVPMWLMFFSHSH